MVMTRDEITEVARATAQEVINQLHSYQIAYQDPKTVLEGLQQSMGEELTAGNWYRRRAINARLKHGDEETAKIYEEIAGDEDSHYVLFSKRADVISGG
jgi:rubrerythrin